MWMWGVLLGSWAVLWLLLRLWYAHRLKKLQSRLDEYQQLASLDPLTGIPNRRAYEVHLAALAKNEASVCLVSLDLNGLKAVNDAEGHDQGDALLRRAARIMQDCCPNEAAVYRVGGDEFMVLVEGLGPRQAGSLVTRLEEELQAAQVDIACGMAYTPSGQGADFKNLRRSSDQAMYQRKQRQKQEHTG